MDKRVHVIGEAGTNHGGVLSVAKQLIDIGVDAAIDSVKFQIIYPDGLYLPRFYVDGKYQDNEVYHIRAAAMLPDKDYEQLYEYSVTKGLPLSASVFDRRSLDLICKFNPLYIKIASCDLNNDRLLIESASRGRKLIVSTGMSSLGDIEHAVNTIVATGNTDLVLMHCVSVYPCTLPQMNLSFLNVLKSAFGFPTGLSDHTESSIAACIAVTHGVEWIEKHYTYDRKAKGFDHIYAMEPAGLREYVQDIRNAEAAWQRPSDKIQPNEANVKKRARRAIYAARDIQPDEIITDADVVVVRPEGPLTPVDLPKIIGCRAKRPLRAYEPLTWDSIR